MDVVTLGEAMVVFEPDSVGNMRYAANFSANVGGAESNLAIGLARLGHQSAWISRLGEDEFGKKVLTFLRGEGVDVSQVKFDPAAATGIYFKERVSDDETRVQYYRKGSAASRLAPSDLSEAYIGSAKFLHVTGITPALSESCRETVMQAMKMAKNQGVTVVFDPNLRRKLWSDDVAKKVLLEMAEQADIVLPGVDEGEFLFDANDPEKIAQRFYDHGASKVIVKLGEKGAYYLSDEESGYVEAYPVKKVVDPVGAGDGFASGLLSGLLDQLSLRKAVQRGAAVGAMVTMIRGDAIGLPERKRLESFMAGANRDVDR